MGLFLVALVREVADLHRNQVRLRFIGDRESLGQELRARMREAEALTALNSGLGLMVAVAGIPDPDLMIRTGGEQRISNFLLWNLAYTELYFSDALWPEFSPAHLLAAFEHFAQRERRFGKTSAQVAAKADA